MLEPEKWYPLFLNMLWSNVTVENETRRSAHLKTPFSAG